MKLQWLKSRSNILKSAICRFPGRHCLIEMHLFNFIQINKCFLLVSIVTIHVKLWHHVNAAFSKCLFSVFFLRVVVSLLKKNCHRLSLCTFPHVISCLFILIKTHVKKTNTIIMMIMSCWRRSGRSKLFLLHFHMYLWLAKWAWTCFFMILVIFHVSAASNKTNFPVFVTGFCLIKGLWVSF